MGPHQALHGVRRTQAAVRMGSRSGHHHGLKGTWGPSRRHCMVWGARGQPGGGFRALTITPNPKLSGFCAI